MTEVIPLLIERYTTERNSIDIAKYHYFCLSKALFMSFVAIETKSSSTGRQKKAMDASIFFIVSKFTEERCQYRVFCHSILKLLYTLHSILDVQCAALEDKVKIKARKL
jgi:hypothetical protein